MIEYEQLPKPDSSVNANNQVAGSPADSAQVIDPMAGLPIVLTMGGLVASNTRAFGGNVPAALLGAATRQIGLDFLELKSQNKHLQTQYEELRDRHQVSVTRVAVLEDRVKSEGKNKNIRNLCITVGMGFIGIGYTQAKIVLDGYVVSAFVIGIVLVAAGWLSGPKPDGASK